MLALIAGGGGLPQRVAATQADLPLVCAYEDVPVEGLTPALTFRLETLGSLIKALKDQGITRVCFCGSVPRPRFDPSKLDADTMPLVPLFQKALAAGDDGALRVLIDIFEQAGMTVIAAHDLAPDLLAQPGVLGAHGPDAAMEQDAARAAQVVATLAPLDIGQCCVVGGAQVFGIEAIGGTDHLLATLPERVKTSRAILFKGPKPGQSRLIDMPTIGPATIKAAHNAGLSGVVIAAGGVIMLEPERCVTLADELGLVLWARAPE
ncbi:UDP-2,3-diacylglucosamine diphosphatase LpxI [uncultured Sulfitobacter sp.]|uniref:LpxI family protein n=1 Tax=uncultured Sulfitobacter sp. TaxID=191468 RepID=UPI0030DA88D1|tara:strand:- start:108474 stop:109265 length:792 start_codon:yes stop_codon:yes gene_type:complete